MTCENKKAKIAFKKWLHQAYFFGHYAPKNIHIALKLCAIVVDVQLQTHLQVSRISSKFRVSWSFIKKITYQVCLGKNPIQLFCRLLVLYLLALFVCALAAQKLYILGAFEHLPFLTSNGAVSRPKRHFLKHLSTGLPQTLMKDVKLMVDKVLKVSHRCLQSF